MFKILKENFPDREKRVLKFWEDHHIFEASLKNRSKNPTFSFYEGPPFATGFPHYGHLLTGTIKDAVIRYKTMKGFYVPRRFGWDCHGLPVENEIEKTKELSGASSIEQFGINLFNEECRDIVLRYTKEWEKTINRMGRWVEFKNAYRTMDLSFMESVWWVFSKLWEKNLVYESFKVMPFSAKLGTPLSNFEANLNYRDVDDPSILVLFPLIDEEKTSLLVWTTTPWTLPSNLALCINANITYVKIYDKQKEALYILSKRRLKAYFKDPKTYDVIETFKGDRLKNKRYQPLFDFFIQHASKKAFTLLEDSFVEEEDGTGIVHMAPAFGEADFFVCTREGIDLVCPVDQNGKFTKEIPDYVGRFVKDADRDIIRRLKADNRLFQEARVRHRYPFCWRSDTPLIYKAVRTWFVSVETIKKELIQANQKIHWIPEHIKKGRFGKWIENARDWAISRNRYWGTPIPIWRTNEGDIKVISNVSELEKLTKTKLTDLHRHHIDRLTFEIEGKIYMRIPEVFDCWFESGSMPYAQNHFPFEEDKEIPKNFPADFVGEGMDQTRGWFYTLNILSTALFKKPAFKNVIVNGIILAEDGMKMSKRLKNYPEPHSVIDKYGADAIRIYLLHSPCVQGSDLRFSEKDVQLVLRQFLIPFWNAYVFFATYAKIYHWKKEAKEEKTLSNHSLDQWILSLLQKLILDVGQAMDAYLLTEAVNPFITFIDQLTNWYIRRCRSRFWSEEDNADRREAFMTLYTVLLELTKVAAPFVPFISEAIFRELNLESGGTISVHLADFPNYHEEGRHFSLEEEMKDVQVTVSMGHALRKECKLKVRQPLARAYLVSTDQKVLNRLQRQAHLIRDELNVKELVFLNDETDFVVTLIKPNYRLLGKKFGPLMNQIKKACQNMSSQEVQTLLEEKSIPIDIEGEKIQLHLEDVLVERVVKEKMIAATKEQITIGLDTLLNEDLLKEGLARELINKINTQRRNEGFEVVDRIDIYIETTKYVEECFNKYQTVILQEVLGIHVFFEKIEGTLWDLNGEKAVIFIKKVTCH